MTTTKSEGVGFFTKASERDTSGESRRHKDNFTHAGHKGGSSKQRIGSG